MECLRHLERQTWTDFEVIIVDDGSTDDTQQAIEQYLRAAPFALRYLRQPNSGAATGRNRAVAELESPLCIFIGDDIFPSPDFVRVHLELHREHPEIEAVALGLTRWSEEGQTVTPFMKWMDWDGTQFLYAGLMRGERPTWRHFYTSNLSLKTAYLRENPFHEGFRRYGMEDIELGYRLAAEHGLRMYFAPQALAAHLHPTTFARTCRRMLDAGEGAFLFGQLWPEQRSPAYDNVFKRKILQMLSAPPFALPLFVRLGEWSLRIACPNRFMKRVLFLHEFAGYDRAARRQASETA